MMNSLRSVRSWATEQGRRAFAGAGYRVTPEAPPAIPPVFIRACVVSKETRRRRTPVRCALLNPYLMQLITEDTLLMGSGDLLEIFVLPSGDDEIAYLTQQLVPLRHRGLEVKIVKPRRQPMPRRIPNNTARPQSDAASASA